MNYINVEHIVNKIENTGGKLPLKYLKKSKVFKDSGGNCTFDTTTGLGHSYKWYELVKVINGVLVLNNYRYSVTTAKHVSKVRALLNTLCLTFIELPAPRGLQDLESLKHEVLRVFGSELVKLKYARKKNTHGLNEAKAALDNAKYIGVKITIKEINAACNTAETNRIERLARK